ncbi:metal ABC transporter substrate-binding protein [Mesorhizobium sp. B3-1-7]|uniref:metal ABC transporter solute-binding protein, Zn/Mn family n=1 Tax=Mesorhizobium sp. B3-1-7 TaxID=2589894 RepID=UPI00112867D4|nr:zinc ABC transporter substrate-binding protein [Mesorhizobium sp. B3-1-7]TPI46848.1 metal ABC transporter substrate-binding protein [Mesorhizobium sp. B3-1-7]
MRRLNMMATLGLSAVAVFAVAAAASAKTLHVVASFTVLADVAKEVGGSNVEVKTIVPADGDPHEYEPTPDDAKNLKAADVVFVSGEGLEGWMDRLISGSGYTGTPVVASEGVKTRTMDEDGKTVTDPHVWNSPVNVEVWVGNIEKALEAADPEGAGHFKANAERYMKKLHELDAYARSKIDPIPQEKRKVLTSHDAFGYFGREYGVSFLSPLGLSTEAEASAGDVAKLIEQIKKEGVKTYFFENSNDPRLVKQIAGATGAEAGGELYVEALSKEDGPAPTYARMFKYNVDQLAAAMAKQTLAQQ